MKLYRLLPLGALALTALASSCVDSVATTRSPAGNDIRLDPGPPNTQPSPQPSVGVSPKPSPSPSPTPSRSPVIGDSCVNSDSAHYCLGMKYVSYVNSSNSAVVDQSRALQNLAVVNSVWSQCNVAFQLEEYAGVDPADYGLSYGGPTAQSQTEQIRTAFAVTDKFLVVSTGAWNSTKQAWTNPPGSAHYGAVLDGSIYDYPWIEAHELGHYLGLDHVSDSANLMNAIIYSSPATLSSSQCSSARATIASYWRAMVRR